MGKSMWPKIRKDFNAAVDRRSEARMPFYEIYLRDITPVHGDMDGSMDRKMGFTLLKD